MKSEKIIFANHAGDELAAVLEWPEDEKPLAFAVFAHCFTCTKNVKAAVHICRALSRRRIAVLRFDFTGLGESGGEFAATTFADNIADIVAAADYLQHCHRAPEILIGHSLGGAAVLQAAERIDTVSAVATLGAPFQPAHALQHFEEAREQIEASGEAEVAIAGRQFTIRKSFLENLRRQDPAATLRRLDAALLVLHSPRDKVVGIDNAADIYQAAKHPKSFLSLDPADHLLSRREDSEYAADMIAAWARRYLKVGPDQHEFPEVIDNRVTVRTPAGGFRTDMFVNGHALVADEPESYGGTDRGPSPYDFLLAALGACTGMTLQMYAGRKQWPLAAAVVRLRHAKIHAEDCAHCEDPGHKIDRFEREIELLGELDDGQRRRLLEIADKCPVHRTLEADVLIETSLRKKDL
ncbi:MAG TPA: bifunctional alpha/beta hydrolase/OsmC family protein [Desulfuromonadales bacterium]|nr:bifunctional alpha/beta hydrolase/OsmC family protein [Desulfuromonadales bacterium]